MRSDCVYYTRQGLAWFFNWLTYLWIGWTVFVYCAIFVLGRPLVGHVLGPRILPSTTAAAFPVRPTSCRDGDHFLLGLRREWVDARHGRVVLALPPVPP